VPDPLLRAVLPVLASMVRLFWILIVSVPRFAHHEVGEFFTCDPFLFNSPLPAASVPSLIPIRALSGAHRFYPLSPSRVSPNFLAMLPPASPFIFFFFIRRFSYSSSPALIGSSGIDASRCRKSCLPWCLNPRRFQEKKTAPGPPSTNHRTCLSIVFQPFFFGFSI